jgi:hypothetical protein
MSWYKQAKLIDVDPPKAMTMHCSYCGRWATTNKENAPKNEAIWKKETDLTPEERNEVQETHKNKMYSSGLCPSCFEFTMHFLKRKINFSPETIKSLTLTRASYGGKS